MRSPSIPPDALQSGRWQFQQTSKLAGSSSTLAYDATALAEDGAGVQDFAQREGLTAHAAAVRVRGQ
jgi:histidinol dehydrogenase